MFETINRRRFVRVAGSAACAGSLIGHGLHPADGQVPAAAASAQQTVTVELPRGRVPLSFIIDDSTCLVNMGKFCMPQFAATYPQREDYQRPWREWPDEIPDSFVREFGEWCAEQGVKGKYSVVPFPACVGWLDRTLPGWSQTQLQESLKLVRELMLPNWDIHPEMITHTRAIDLKTGRPFADFSPKHMENSYPPADVSVDYLTSYLAYALRILKNCDLPCEGITTPGGFGNNVKDKLPLAVFDAVRDVYGSELPHYFKYVVFDEDSTEPKLEAIRDRNSEHPKVTANVLAGTGDWFGGWDGFDQSQGERYSNEDATSGRMVEMIERRQPAVMLCHWPGLYSNGSLAGFHDFQRVVLALSKRYQDQTLWMKLSEIARYWTAKEFTEIVADGNEIRLRAQFACENFTVRVTGHQATGIQLIQPGTAPIPLASVSTLPSLGKNQMLRTGDDLLLCFDLPKGDCKLAW
ncbi:MAG: hypothetical protein R3C53_14405 [Pirellulaceae bacterium]